MLAALPDFKRKRAARAQLNCRNETKQKRNEAEHDNQSGSGQTHGKSSNHKMTTNPHRTSQCADRRPAPRYPHDYRSEEARKWNGSVIFERFPRLIVPSLSW
jgi:hypothetical protein